MKSIKRISSIVSVAVILTIVKHAIDFDTALFLGIAFIVVGLFDIERRLIN